MACNCIKDSKELFEQRIKDDLKREHGDRRKYLEGEFANMTLAMTGNRQGWNLTIPFEYKVQFVKADGTEGKTQSKSVAVFFTFCPFCGKQYVEETQVGDQANV